MDELLEQPAPFLLQQPCLGFQTTWGAVTVELAVGANDAMAWNNDGHWIGGIGSADGPNGSWPTNLFGDSAIGA